MVGRERNGPTMADVAKKAGVALGTVSRVINGEQVGEAYREKVMEAIKALGYRYNNSGRALRTNRTNTIALIIPNTINPYFGLLAHHINIALEKRNYKMMLCFTEYDRDRETEFLQMAQENMVDGIIALTYNPDLVIPESIPFVTIDRFFSVKVPCVSSDNYGGGVMAARKLRELGCTNLAFMRTASILINEPSKRMDGFAAACREMHIPYEVIALDEKQPYSEFESFLSKHFKDGKLAFDGLFIGTDSLAWEIIKTLKQMGVRVPEDVQVIGFDGIRMFGDQEYIVSTIVQPVPALARASVNMILSDDPTDRPSLMCLPVTYVSAGTTRD